MKPTVGEQLRSARESRGLTLEDAVKATNIRRAYLQELENDHPELLHSDAQARGFLRLYASYLGIPTRPLIALWDQPEPDLTEAEETTPEVHADPGSQEPQAETPDEQAASDGKIDEVDATAVENMSDGTEAPDQLEIEKPEEEAIQEETPSRLQNVLNRIPKISQILPKREKPSKKEKPTRKTVDGPEEKLPEAEPDTVLRSSREIMGDIGSALHERRSALELTLSDAETFTNVKRMYLEAMEAGAFERLPSTVQGKGMLNHYARFLGLDETWIMDAYAKALLAVRVEKEASKPRKAAPPLTVRLNIPEKWRRILNPDLIVGGVLIIALFTFLIWGGAQVFSSAEPTATEAPSISEVLAQTPTPTPPAADSPADDGEPTEEATALAGVTVVEPTATVAATVNAAPLQLYIIVSDRAFLQVTVDGESVFDGRVEADDVFTFSGEEAISLLTGNGAALEVYFNQEYLGSLGTVGEVANLTFALDGLRTPTPQPTETPQAAELPSAEDAMEMTGDG